MRMLCSLIGSLLLLQAHAQSGNAELRAFYAKWRAFEKPPTREGAPDYTAETFEKRIPRFQELQESLQQIDTANWPIENKIDWMIGCLIGCWFIFPLTAAFAATAIVTGLVLSSAGRVIGYWLKINDDWL